MNRVRLLSEQVANQIAAGEVIERPASVVKELIENAIDAGATEIAVDIRAGGRALIRVADNGTGMSRDDALMSLERHATSKIREAADLTKIATMGFRGEALPSIASVSRFTLTTREQGDEVPEGTQIIVSGGRVGEVKAAGRDSGTTVEVRNLFFNLPARRKFLRTEETERSHIQHYLTLVALAHPHIAFWFRNNDRMVWQLRSIAVEDQQRVDPLLERWRALHPGDTDLIPLDATSSAGGLEPLLGVWGVFGGPGVSRATRENQYCFVNRRPVESRGLNRALLEGYHTVLMKGRFPVCCLFLELPPDAVDVNVHPAKREVRFHDERGVRAVVSSQIRTALLEYHRRQTARAAPAPSAPLEALPPGSDAVPSTEIDEDVSTAEPAPQQSVSAVTQLEWPTAGSGGQVLRDDAGAVEAATRTEPSGVRESAGGAEGDAATGVNVAEPAGANGPLLERRLQIAGVVGKLYVVLESDRGLVLMDQHAAHERVLYEQMLRRMETRETASQRLLMPETIELHPRDAEFLKGQIETLNRLGVEIREFGERTFLLEALPPFVRAGNAKQFALDLVDQLKAVGEGVNAMRLGEGVVAKTVCRHAVKANDTLRGPELEALLRDLRGCEMPYTCPHGRPTLIEMTYRELERRFGRSV